MHLQQAADALGPARAGVQNRVAGLEHARVDTNKDELTDKRVGHDLEAERGQRLAIVRVAKELDLRLAWLRACDRRNIQRARQVIDNRIEQRLHTLVLEGRTAEHREDVHRDRRLANRTLQLLDRDLLALEVLMHHFFIGVRNRLDQLGAQLFSILPQRSRNLFHIVLRAHGLVVPQDRLHLHEVDDASKLRLFADRNLNRNRTRAEALNDGRSRVLKVRAGLVHLVDEANTRNLVLVGLTPHRLGLWLHTLNGIEARDRAIEHTQRTLHLSGEVHVTGGIDNVDANAVPRAGGRSRGDGDSTLLLLLHPIHGGRALVHLADTVRDARIEQDALGRRRLAGVDVSHDANVPAFCERYCACHDSVSFLRTCARGKSNFV